MARTTRPGESDLEPFDDYHVGSDVESELSASQHVLAVINVALLIVMALVSAALFWIVASLLGLV